jgi:Fe-S cluster assembly protein SufD
MKPSLLIDHPFGEIYARRLGVAPWAGGLPGPKVEDWRFTPLRALAKVAFAPATGEVSIDGVPRNVPKIAGAARLVLVNGAYRAELSDAGLGKGVEVTQGKVAGKEGSSLVALNAAYAPSSLVIHATAAAKKLVHIISIAAADAEPTALHPRVTVTAEPGSALTLVESHVGLAGQTYFSNPVTSITVGEGATVRRYVGVDENSDAFHLATTLVKVAGRGTFEGFHLGLGGALVRQEIRVVMTGENAAVRLNGVYALGGASHHDYTTLMDHAFPNCTSSQVFKGVVDGQSHGVYQGRIHVARDAQKTDARQLHKALFLSRGPQVDCKPELEIYADDVQCAHGATTGEIDESHMFYLAARGIDAETARALLVEGFLAEAVAEIGDAAVREIFGAAVSNWLKRREPARGAA